VTPVTGWTEGFQVKVVAVAQAFKETLTVSVVAGALEAGIRAAGCHPVVLRASDGGDGLLEALGDRFVRRTRHRVSGPLEGLVEVEAGWLDPGTALVESRMVCGLSLVPPAARNPSATTTRGVGELISQLEVLGAARILVGLGGTATMDGGIGMARAWGWMPLDAQGHELREGGGALADLASLRRGTMPRAAIVGLADVRNPLTGAAGARVYGPQKGAAAADLERLALGLDRLAEIAAGMSDPALPARPGAGAAGGLGFGITFFANGALESGAPWVLGLLDFAAVLKEADLVLCTEGAFDLTSLEGKLTGTVISLARQAGIPTGLLAPTVAAVPHGVLVEAGGGRWSGADLERRTEILVRRAPRTRRDA
jgi:glycerate kinase